MMINKRLIGTVSESKKFVAGNVALQWLSLLANMAMMTAITALLAALARGEGAQVGVTETVAVVAAAVRFACTVGASRMGYLSSKAVKRTLREKIYQKLLRLGAGYRQDVSTAEVVQVAVEGVDQLETYFGAYLPQFFYAMLAPLTLFAYLCTVSVPSAVVLLVCVPPIPVAIALMSSFGPCVALANLGSTLQSTFAAGNRVLDILEENPLVEGVNGQPRVEFTGAAADNLSFSYGGEQVLSGLSLDIAKGKVTGIVGRSGSGKSTFLKLLMRFWQFILVRIAPILTGDAFIIRASGHV